MENGMQMTLEECMPGTFQKQIAGASDSLARISQLPENSLDLKETALHIMQRMCSHLTGYQHIDLSVKKRGFYSADNPYGWKLNFKHYPASELDKWEQYWILEYTKRGYQCRYNKTAGGQGEGKEKINEFRPAKGYHDGLKQGRKNMARELSHIIDTHLTVSLKCEKQNNKVSQRAFEKFNELLEEGK